MPNTQVPSCTFEIQANGIDVQWTEVTGVDKYIVEKMVNGGGWNWSAAQNAPASALDPIDEIPNQGAGAAIEYRVDTKPAVPRT